MRERPASFDVGGITGSRTPEDPANHEEWLTRAATLAVAPPPVSPAGKQTSTTRQSRFTYTLWSRSDPLSTSKATVTQPSTRGLSQNLATEDKSDTGDSEQDITDAALDGVDSEKCEVVIQQHTPSDPGPPPYHVFTTRQKWQLVYIVSLAGLFSPLSSNIYFPALGAIATELNTSISLVALTVTIYMVVQGLAPSFWGPLSDTRGRRVTFIGTFAVYLVANVGLALSKDFASLMVFRAVQAAGSAATISVGAGVISDITTSKERGGFLGSFGGIRMLGQSIGPVVGGIITEYFGFHAIFWFLFILGTMALLTILLFLPETLRRIAGNGSVPLPNTLLYRPIFPHAGNLQHHWQQPEKPTTPQPPPPFTLTSLLSPLRLLVEKDVLCALVFGAVVYAIWSMVTSSTTALMQTRYALTSLQVGLVFLPNGAGCVSGSYAAGKLLDRDYAYYSLKSSTGGVPITRARLRSAWYLIPVFVLAVGGYGFAVVAGPLPLPLVLQFVIAFGATAIFTQNSALMVDLYPGASASATAVNNLVRCAVGAAGVAGVQPLVDGVEAGIAFLVLSGAVVALAPLLGVVWVFGERWRAERAVRFEGSFAGL
ncbi:major facilitator superfamily domain-containing protein [Podospora appendiculata]|uniref:Major facilitator superfamily domain-containing protein n=1 Tax=Podospora appendiculata TaxID=314037 RepID=A0AAE1CGG5_9PEZI|nr:major facilitator superfamily domain-containing protein [Podospora appendiculata]